MGPDPLARGRGFSHEQVSGGQYHPRRAETTLNSATLEECILQVSDPPCQGRAFDRLDDRPVYLDRQHETASRDRAIHNDRACAANALLTADMHTGIFKIAPQEVGETL